MTWKSCWEWCLELALRRVCKLLEICELFFEFFLGECVYIKDLPLDDSRDCYDPPYSLHAKLWHPASWIHYLRTEIVWPLHDEFPYTIHYGDSDERIRTSAWNGQPSERTDAGCRATPASLHQRLDFRSWN